MSLRIYQTRLIRSTKCHYCFWQILTVAMLLLLAQLQYNLFFAVLASNKIQEMLKLNRKQLYYKLDLNNDPK